jgi:hypothetical protein
MAKQLEIQLKFTTKGANKLIETLKILAQQQNKVAASQRKFNAANLKAVTATKKLLMAEEKHRSAMTKNARQISILNRRIEKLTFANKKLSITTKKTVKAQNRMRISTSGLQRVVGSLRNKILLFTFAFGGLITMTRKFVQTSSEFEAVKVRLNAMFGSVEKGTKAFNTFNKIAATTPFTLQDVVEGGAALKAFGADAEALMKPTADLAAFMGTTATEAASALGRAFAGGAGAADILRERGILQLVRDFKGIDDLTKLTLPQFRQAIEDTLLDPASGIAGSTDKLAKTMVGLTSNLSDAFTRMGAALGNLIDFTGVIKDLTGGFSRLAEHFTKMNESPFDTTIRQLKEIGVNTASLELSQANLLKTRMEEAGITDNLVEVNEDMALKTHNRKIVLEEIARLQQILEDKGVDELALLDELAKMDSQRRLADEEMKLILDEKNKKRRKEIGILLEQNHLTFEAIRNNQGILAQVDAQIASGAIRQDQALEYKRIVAEIFGLEKSITTEKAKQVDLGFSFSFDPQGLIDSYSQFFELTEVQEKLMDEAEALRLQTREEIFSKHFNKVLSIAQKSIDAQKEAELSALRDTDKFRNASAEERDDMEKDALKKLQKKQNLIFKLNQANEIVNTIMSSIETASNIKDMRDELAALSVKLLATPGGTKAGLKAAKGAAALTAQRGAVIASGAAQAGLIAGQKPPAFARGGSFITGGEQMIMVGDNSGGRERVDITPLSSPDFGDAGGGSSINVNIMGNVIGTQEFVRDNLLPEIENTIKRNLA